MWQKLNRSENLIVWLSILISVIINLISVSKYGPALSTDTGSYFSAAQNFLDGNGFLTFFNQRYANWPPLYPLALAFFKLIGINFIVSSLLMNVISVMITTFISVKWIFSLIKNIPIRIIGIILVVFCPSVYFVHIVAWTDSLFIGLTLLFIYYSMKFVKNASGRNLVTISVIAGISVLLRYSGIVFYLFAIAIIWSVSEKSWKIFLRRYGVILIGFLPVVVWLVRNQILTGTLTGQDRFQETTKGILSVVYMLKSMFQWIIPQLYAILANKRDLFLNNLSLFIPLLGILISTAVFVLIRFFRKFWKKFIEGHFPVEIKWFFIFSSVYLVFILITSFLGLHTPPSNFRFLAPAYIPVLLSFLILINSFSVQLFQKNTIVLSAFLVLLILFHTSFVLDNANRGYSSGAGGYNSITWHNSPAIKWIKKFKFDGAVYSNDNTSVYFANAGRAFYVTEQNSSIASLRNELKKGQNAYCIFFNENLPSKWVPKEILINDNSFRLLKEFPDCRIYLLEK